jgi:hypothetical protein
MTAPTLNEVAAMLYARYADVSLATSWGETALFYNPGKRLPRGIYFATLKDHDGANDKASALHRLGVFRLSLGLPRGDYISRFGPMPLRPGKGGVVLGPWGFHRPGPAFAAPNLRLDGLGGSAQPIEQHIGGTIALV